MVRCCGRVSLQWRASQPWLSSLPGSLNGWMGRVAVRVLDSSGRGVPASVELVSRTPEFEARAAADSEGHAVIRRVPPGTYRLAVRHPGLAMFGRQIELRSAVPQVIEVVLSPAPVQEEITVRGFGPFVRAASAVRRDACRSGIP